jgi:hypothetical protein
MSEITVTELKNRRAMLQKDLHLAIRDLVETFKLDTGVQIDYISVNMIAMEAVGRPPERILGSVTVDLDI